MAQNVAKRASIEDQERLPGPSAAEVLEAELAEFTLLRAKVLTVVGILMRYGRVEGDGVAIAAEAKAFLADGHERLARRSAGAVKPATVGDIGRHLSMLVGSVGGRKTDMDAYQAALVEDVGSLSPCVGAVERACRVLRRTVSTLPPIVDVIGAVRADNLKILRDVDRVQSFARLVADLDQAMADAPRRLEQLRAEDAAYDRLPAPAPEPDREPPGETP